MTRAGQEVASRRADRWLGWGHNDQTNMATLSDRVTQNVAGRFYVDSTCIDCDQCRATAPEFFGRNDDGLSFVQRQPVTAEEIALLEQVAAECATNSIGNDGQ